jgi:hypothetical protein
MQGPPLVGEVQDVAATLDQPHSQTLLQLGNTPRQRGLGSPGRSAGAAEATVGDYQVEVL